MNGARSLRLDYGEKRQAQMNFTFFKKFYFLFPVLGLSFWEALTSVDEVCTASNIIMSS
jgi:hypothetical protein